MREDKEVELIGVPFDMGAGILGARLAPEAVRLKGVIPLLEKLGYMVNSSDLKLENSYENTEVGNMKNLELVKKLEICCMERQQMFSPKINSL